MRVNEKTIRQFVVFGFVGVGTLIVDVLVTSLCFYQLGLPAYLASAIGFMSGFFFNFPLNRKKVFKHDEHDRFGVKSQVVMYIALAVTNLIVSSAAVDILVSLNVPIQFSKILITILIALWNFALFKYVVFSKRVTN